MTDRPGNPIILIERKYPPHGWVLPGGFVDVGETLKQAIREAKEETSLDVKLETLQGCYSDPARDKRMHTASAVYMAKVQGEAKAEDDAKNLNYYLPNDYPKLVFDHQEMLRDYLHYRQSNSFPSVQTD